MSRQKQPDPARLLELMWGTGAKPRKGPRPAISAAQLVQAAIALADAEGIGAVTIRRMAAETGVAVMSVYTYVADKTELIELMIDAAWRELDGAYAQKDWRMRIEALARANYAHYLLHPWLTEVHSEQPPLGPGVIGKYEQELRAFEGLGLSDVEIDAALSFVLNFVRTAARDAILSARQQRVSSNAEWWAAVGPALAAVMRPEDFPLASRVGSAAGAANQGAYNAEAAWAFGLARVLDGLAPLIRKTAAKPQRSTR